MYEEVFNYRELLITRRKNSDNDNRSDDGANFDNFTCNEIDSLVATNNPMATVQEKACALAEFILSVEDFADNIEKHEGRLYMRRIKLTKQAQLVRAHLLQTMQAAGLQILSSPLLHVSFRASSAVNISDASLLPPEYVHPDKVVRGEPDKPRIAEDLKLGVLIPGASLEKRINLQIK